MAILKRWNGSIYTPARRVLYWNGSSWVERCKKYWTGSTYAVAVTKELWVDDYVRGLWHLNEGSGTNAYDASGNGLTMHWGEYQESERPIWQSGGKPGWGALAFDMKRASINYSPHWNFGGGPFTIEAWVSGGGVRGNNEIVIGRYSGTTSWWLGYQENTGYPEFLLRNSAGTLKTIVWPSNIHTEAWHYLAAIKGSTHMRLFVDGTERVNDTHPGGSYDHASAGLQIGWYAGWNDYPSGFNLGELRLSHGIERLSTEIGSIWNANN
ncbi:hypothetical protein ES708_25394 [subsurface metagenome]